MRDPPRLKSGGRDPGTVHGPAGAGSGDWLESFPHSLRAVSVANELDAS